MMMPVALSRSRTGLVCFGAGVDFDRVACVSSMCQVSQTRTCPIKLGRNWQTHQLEGLAVAIPWGFESPLSHQPSLASGELRLGQASPGHVSTELLIREGCRAEAA